MYELLGGGLDQGAAAAPISTLSKEEKRKRMDSELQKLINSADEYLDDETLTEDDDELVEVDEDDITTEEAGSSAVDSSADDEAGGRGNNYQMEFRQHKREYYIQKMRYDKVDPSVLREQAEGYVRAIQWNLHYYYHGCMSWSWFYPHHYSPWITDIRDFTDMSMDFELSRPFKPFEQLLAVLPAASKELLPKPLQGLMINETSPIIDYFPPEFECDLNGKQQEWEAVVLIPFIDENRLLEAMKEPLNHLSKEESSRNSHGPMVIGEYTSQDLGAYESPAYFPVISRNHAKLTMVT